MPALNVLFPTLGDTAAATTNRTKIQSLLDAGGMCELIGDGIAYIDGILAIGSDTHFKVDPRMTIMQKNATNRTLLESAAYQRSWASVTVAWTAGLAATVTWVGHGRSAGQHIWIRGTPGTTDPALIGVFQVASVTGADTLVVTLRRTPAATGSGTTEAKLCDENICLEGGTWNYNDANNTPSDPLERHALILGGVNRLIIKDVAITEAQKYCLCLGGVRNFLLDGVYIFDTTSDGVKIYGPAFDGEVRRLRGEAHDDGISIQTKEPAAFSAYDFTQGGDLLSINISDVSLDDGTTAGVVVYAGPYFFTDDINIEGVSYQGASVAVKIDNNDSAAAANAGAIRVGNVEQGQSTTSVMQVITSGGDLTIARLDITDFRTLRNAPTGTSINLINIDNGITCKMLCFDRGNMRFARNDFVLSISGTIEELMVQNARAEGVGGNLGRMVVLQSGSAVKNITFQNNELTNLDACVNVASGAGLAHISGIGNNVNFAGGSFISLSASAKVFVAGNKADAGALGNGFVRVNGAITVDVDSGGGNLVPSGKWVVKVGGSEVVNLRGWDFKVDVSAMARFDGGFCYNTNAALGTLAAAGLVACQGTAANSWRLLGDPTLRY